MLSSIGLRGALGLLYLTSSVLGKCTEHWVDIWGSMPQLVEPANLPNPPYNASGVVFQNATLRQTVYITQDASTIRLQFSNAFGGSDLPITAVTVALPGNLTAAGGAGTSSIDTTTIQTVTFSGSAGFIVPNGALVVSDPIKLDVKAQSVLAVTMYLAQGQTTNSITGHPGSRTTSYMVPGNHVSTADVAGVEGSAHVDHWYFLTTIEGWLPASRRALVVVGDSISDGRGSTTNANNRWPDQLLSRMQSNPETKGISVINEAAGGNRILYDGLGPNALGRIERDVIAQSGVGYAIIYEGVNDIGTAATDVATQKANGDRVISAYDQMITRLHRRGTAVFGATITPMSGPGQTYSDPNREAQRQRINEWIRTSGRFDAVVDFDKAVRDPNNGTQLSPLYNSGDYLHLNPEGYRVMAATVDLGLFSKFAGGVHTMT
ncbi:SGNH hydrolase-type esterase domain-containing protein [Diplogelasinospora grovesii]|uniref:SGNH hydrolase-type esterase domain-containing protein n=1 Tax=Diplogelasinospora grovesii TaxID=303347 RepID=A0AAN6NEH6_9PEZI|nr:SGNH hydrolase-type esterase domain-containing protein [Diplogelasinospora grovesii]